LPDLRQQQRTIYALSSIVFGLSAVSS